MPRQDRLLEFFGDERHFTADHCPENRLKNENPPEYSTKGDFSCL